MLIISNTESELTASVGFIVETLKILGFMINFEKSVMQPCKKLIHLGFQIDSDSVNVTLLKEKVMRVISLCKELIDKEQDTIRNVAKVIGTLVACFPAVQLGSLRYRNLEREKDFALKGNRGDFDATMIITDGMRCDLQWWVDNINSQENPIVRNNPEIMLTSDASLEGWGGTCGTERFGGRWNEEEKVRHINLLELLGAFFVLKVCKNHIEGKHVHMLLDNTTAIAYINHMGGKHGNLNSLAVEVWNWCLEHDIWLSAAHLPGVENVEADYESRHFNDRCEWSLHEGVFQRLIEVFGKPEIDLFASRLNATCTRFVAWQRDPHAEFIDAFSRDWSYFYAYVFPPFSLIGRTLQKIRAERTRALMIVPCWPTQPWFSMFLQMLSRRPVLLPKMDKLLVLKFSEQLHPLRKKLTLIAGHISGEPTETQIYQSGLPLSSCVPGNQELTNSIQCTSGDGMHFVSRGRSIVFPPLSM